MFDKLAYIYSVDTLTKLQYFMQVFKYLNKIQKSTETVLGSPCNAYYFMIILNILVPVLQCQYSVMSFSFSLLCLILSDQLQELYFLGGLS